jgi:kynurenine formamidase
MIRLIDLSVDLYEGMPKFASKYHARFAIKTTSSHGSNKCLAHKIEMATHTGTHIDAPLHFIPNGNTIDKISLEVLISTAYVVNLKGKNAGSVIAAKDVEHIKLYKNAGVLLKTGWYHHWDTGDFYNNPPTLTEEAAQLLIERGVEFLAVDIPLSVQVHQIVLGAGKILIENLTNLDAITVKKIKLYALPLRIRNAEAAPARVVAEI